MAIGRYPFRCCQSFINRPNGWVCALNAGFRRVSIAMDASGYRIKSAGMERMALQQPTGTEIGTFQHTMAVDGFQGIFGTGGIEPAAGTNERGDDELISADKLNGRESADWRPRAFNAEVG